MTSYNYSISTNFGGNFNQYNFHNEIKASSGITKTLIGVNRTGDNIDVIFGQALSIEERNLLESSLIPNHNSTPTIISSNVITLYPEIRFTKSEIYDNLGDINYPGSVYQTMNNIKIIGYMDIGCTSYSVKIYDLTNNIIIKEAIFTNTTNRCVDMGTLVNIPSNDSIIEVHAKRNGGVSGNKVYIKSVQFYVK